MKTILTLVFFFTPFFLFCQKIAYHQYEPTVSDYRIVRWNIPKDSLKFFRRYVEEQTDEKGRVVELRFLENGDWLKDRLCYLPDFVTYQYPDNKTIVECLYNSDSSKMNGLECEVEYKTVYTIDGNYNITKARREYFADTSEMIENGFSSRDINIEMTFLKKDISDSITLSDATGFVVYYLKSFSKLNRQFPVSKKFSDHEWTGNDPESTDVRICLMKK